MVRRIVVLVMVAAFGYGIVAGVEGEADCQPQNVFQAESSEGVAWANVTLTRQRVAEPYLPIVIGIQNTGPKEVKVTRDSIWLSDQSGVVYSMPTVKEVRGGYDKILADSRLSAADGIPWMNWRQGRRFEPSNFFPDMRAQRGNTTKDRVTLRSGFGMVDLFYFERPRDLAPCKPFFVVVNPEGWQTPIRFSVFIS
jgi:hypothetical protein